MTSTESEATPAASESAASEPAATEPVASEQAPVAQPPIAPATVARPSAAPSIAGQAITGQPISAQLAKSLKLPAQSIERTIELLDAGNTLPFIARYRRDRTGGLDEEQIGAIREALAHIRQVEDRRSTILRSLESQGKLTDELKERINNAHSVRELDDLYLPFKPKKQTLASRAREQGLDILADEIFRDDDAAANLDQRAADFINTDKGIDSAALAITGAGHILAEKFSEDFASRQAARDIVWKTGQLTSSKVDETNKKNDVYKDYFEFREKLSALPPHRVLAINRGERAKVLKVGLACDNAAIEQGAIERLVPAEHRHRELLIGCVKDAINRLVLPSLEREARRELTEKAENHGVVVFARNLRKLLLQPPLASKRVLAIDPGYKNGCKTAAIDQFGQVLETGLFHVVGSDDAIAAARQKIVEMFTKHELHLIAIGNGSACRATEELVAQVLGTELAEKDAAYIIVNEAGASVYSTSAIGREEFPELEAVQRSAVSIGRRLQDPLSELVKIDPGSIGVGLYQHDNKEKHLRDSLDEVVQSCVSFVGVDVNTASAALLRYVAGLNQLTARRILEHRATNGPFQKRDQLKSVSGIGEATFVQAAGFLKISGGDEPLDCTWVHPESYDSARRLLEKLGVDAATLRTAETAAKFEEELAKHSLDELAAQLEIGRLTLEQVIESLRRPGRDPREDLPPPLFRRDVVRFEDLAEGMQLRGVVLNVVDFGAFVDVGLSDSGLVHISQLSTGYVRDPHDVVAVGDQVDVWVQTIDKERRRVALTMIAPGTPRSEPPRRERGNRDKSASGRPPRRRRPSKQPVAAGAAPAIEGAAPAAEGASATAPRTDRPPREARPAAASGQQSNGPPRDGQQRGGQQRGGPPRSGSYGGGNRRGGSRMGGGKPPELSKRDQAELKRLQGKKKPAKPLPPITKEMVEGKEAMRSFGDLLQFVKKKKDGDSADPKE